MASEQPASDPAYLELYKLSVEMADRVSARRGVANSFFLTINTGVIALLGAQDLRWYVAVAGIVLCCAWWALLKSYHDLNEAKFEIIHALEDRLPMTVSADEWASLKRDPVSFALRRDAIRGWAGQYRELGHVERLVPCVFVGIYIAEIIRQTS